MKNIAAEIKRGRYFRFRRMHKGQWYWVDKAIIPGYAKMVGAVAMLVYHYIASLANKEQSCFPSQQHIAHVLGYSRATINRAIKRLRQTGLIAVEKTNSYRQRYHLLDIRSNNSD